MPGVPLASVTTLRMKSLTAALTVLGLTSAAFACLDDHDHDHSHNFHKRLEPQTQLTSPTRPLQWSDINVSNPLSISTLPCLILFRFLSLEIFYI
jgi:hypothetical protein